MGALGGNRRLGRRSRLYELLLAPLSVRERVIFLSLLVTTVVVLAITSVGAGDSQTGSYAYAPFSNCLPDDENPAAWSSAQQAAGQPDADLQAEIKFERAAQQINPSGHLVCTNIQSDAKALLNPAIRLYISATAQTPPTTSLVDNGDTSQKLVSPPQRYLDANRDQSKLDGIASVEWTTDHGQTWRGPALLSPTDISNGPVNVRLAHIDAGSLDGFAIRVSALAVQESGRKLLIDSAGLVFEIGSPTKVDVSLDQAGRAGAVLPAAQEFEAQIELDGPGLNLAGVLSALASDQEPDASFSAYLTAPDDSRFEVKVDSEWLGSDLIGRPKWELSYSPPATLKPGKYILSTQAGTAEGELITDQQAVLWGVVALNTAKSSYSPGENIELMLSVLDERGASVCDADISLDIKLDEQTAAVLSTSEGLEVTDTCQLYGQHIQADYIGSISLSEPGIYTIHGTIATDGLNYSITDTLIIAPQPELVIERLGPTRVFPLNPYTMQIELDLKRDFRGRVQETVPLVFKLEPSRQQRPYETEVVGDNQVLSWTIDGLAGDKIKLEYEFDAPDISPVFYTLGPLALEDTSNGWSYQEPRRWQIAGDAVGRMLLFWAGGTVPSGWTCVSCSGGDPFYQRFIRGDETYGGTGGNASHSHTASGSVDATVTPMPARSNAPPAIELNNNDHSHTFSPTVASSSHLPSYRQLQVIRYDTTGTPATLPAGVIALFDNTVPSGWTRYSAQDGFYVRGESTVGTTGGDTAHTHAVSGTTGAATSGERRRATAGAQTNVAASGHTHDASGTSSSTNHEPPYIEAILGQLDSDSSPSDNMIAMWDDSPPAEWQVRSEPGGSFNLRFFKAATAFGATGGASSHSHPDSTYASGPSSAAVTSRVGGTPDASDAAHTHDINLTGGSTESSLPPYINVIIAKKQTPSTLTQASYRWYANQDSTDVGSPLASQDTATTSPPQGTPFRLRFLIHVSDADRGLFGSGLKLQVAARSGSCDTSFIGESYSDVSSSSGDIRYYDNSAASDASALTANANDPDHSGHNVNDQSYEESNNFTNGVSAIAAGEDGLWDMALVDFSAAPSTGYCFRVVRATDDLLDTYDVVPEITTDDGAAHMLLLWDGGGEPSGWSCVSCNPGDDFYQRFIRGEETYGGTGGAETHNHTANATLTDSLMDGRGAVGSGLIRAHTHTLAPNIGGASNLPVYRQLKVIRADTSGTPGTLPAGAIALFNAAAPSGWTRYSAQDNQFIRGEGTVGSTGGSNSHIHTITGTTSVPSTGVLRAPNTATPQQQNATDNHTHSISGNSNSSPNEPPYIDTILAELDSDGSVPTGMIAMWDGTPATSWTVHSESGDPFFQTFIRPAATYGGTGGAASHSHTNVDIATGGPSATTATNVGGTNTSNGSHTHTATISGISTDSHLPPYINVVVAELTGSNNPPDAPASLDQIKVSDSSSIAVGGWSDDVQIRFSASLSDSDNPDDLSICVEVQPTGTGFSGNEADCGASVTYAGSPVTATVTLFGLTDGEQYHWQARTKDSFGSYSAWVSFGANAETAIDFAIDNTDPLGTVYDGLSLGSDVDLNDGSLNTLSANWDITDSDSGISGYDYSIGTSPSATDILNWTNNGILNVATAITLSLNTAQPYYFNVRASDNAGNQSVVSSDGILVSSTLQFSTSPTIVEFDNLNASNGYSDIETATLTTSTNAYAGYEIRAYLTALPSALSGPDVIGLFDGGSYASPDEWLSGDTGYGYTSNDATIQGVNIFNSTPCPGGGNPPCYAPFSLSSPGDIVADHTNLISGNPVVNENFILTQRITVAQSQAAGDYQTEIIYSITARY